MAVPRLRHGHSRPPFHTPELLVNDGTSGVSGACAIGGPALDLASGAYGPKRARAVTSAMSPRTTHRTSSAFCAPVTSLAASHASVAPSNARSAAARAARSAAAPAWCLATTAWPIASTAAKTAHSVAVVTATHTVATPRSRFSAHTLAQQPPRLPAGDPAPGRARVPTWGSRPAVRPYL